MRSAEPSSPPSRRAVACARGAIRLALGWMVALSACCAPLDRAADTFDATKRSDRVAASWIPNAPEPGEGAATPAKLAVAELEKDGSNKTKKVHSAFVGAIAAADALWVAPASCVRRELEVERRCASGPSAEPSARAPPLA